LAFSGLHSYIPEDRILRNHRCENLIPYIVIKCSHIVEIRDETYEEKRDQIKYEEKKRPNPRNLPLTKYALLPLILP
jgi:hypothetical protein